MNLEIDKLKELAQTLYKLGEKYWKYHVFLNSDIIKNLIFHIPALFEDGLKEIKLKSNFIIIIDEYNEQYKIPLCFYDKLAVEIEKLFIEELSIEISQKIVDMEIQLENLKKNQIELIDVKNRL